MESVQLVSGLRIIYNACSAKPKVSCRPSPVIPRRAFERPVAAAPAIRRPSSRWAAMRHFHTLTDIRRGAESGRSGGVSARPLAREFGLPSKPCGSILQASIRRRSARRNSTSRARTSSPRDASVPATKAGLRRRFRPHADAGGCSAPMLPSLSVRLLTLTAFAVPPNFAPDGRPQIGGPLATTGDHDGRLRRRSVKASVVGLQPA